MILRMGWSKSRAMSEKKDKDIWEKLSTAASSAGRTIGDEYRRLKLNHGLWNLRRDLKDVYTDVGKLIHNRYLARGTEVDDELKALCIEIDELLGEIEEIKRHRDAIRQTEPETGKSTPSGAGQSAPEADGHEPEGGDKPEDDESELEFLDDEDIQFYCRECGCRMITDTGELPNYCHRCGHRLPTE